MCPWACFCAQGPPRPSGRLQIPSFIPVGAERIANQLAFSLGDGGVKTVREWTDALAGEELPKAKPVFPRIEVETEEEAEVPA